VRIASRASHRDRKNAVSALRVHHAEGRLDDDEFEARLELASWARTRSDVGRSMRGLPSAGIHRFVRRAAHVLLGLHIAAFATINLVVVTIWALTGEGTFWPAWMLVPTTALLAWHAIASFTLTRALARRRPGRQARKRLARI
jgi:hypothetical protein